jgi:hypothetical protein
MGREEKRSLHQNEVPKQAYRVRTAAKYAVRCRPLDNDMPRISAAGSRLPYEVSFGDTVTKVKLNKMLVASCCRNSRSSYRHTTVCILLDDLWPFRIGRCETVEQKCVAKLGRTLKSFMADFLLKRGEKARYRNVIDLPIFVQSPKSCTADSSCCSMQGQQQKQWLRWTPRGAGISGTGGFGRGAG